MHERNVQSSNPRVAFTLDCAKYWGERPHEEVAELIEEGLNLLKDELAAMRQEIARLDEDNASAPDCPDEPSSVMDAIHYLEE